MWEKVLPEFDKEHDDVQMGGRGGVVWRNPTCHRCHLTEKIRGSSTSNTSYGNNNIFLDNKSHTEQYFALDLSYGTPTRPDTHREGSTAGSRGGEIKRM